jgi:capsular exopolysaccharide synthesis family protein
MDMELNKILAPLRKWWWLLLVSTLLAAGSSYVMVNRQPYIYQAKAVLMIGSAFESLNPTGNELNLGQQLAGTYADIAGRQMVQEQTMAVLGLNSLPQYVARQLPQSQLLEIVVTDISPERAQAVANELANQLILQSPTAPKPEEQERDAFIDDQLNSLQTKIKATEEEIIENQNQLEDAFSAREIADLQGEIAALQQKLNALQSNYASLLANSQGGAINTLSVIEPAHLPQVPVGPQKARVVIAAAAIALTLAVGTAYLLEYLDDTIRTTQDIEDACNLPLLPSIPEIESERKPHMLITLDQPLSPAADAFRALRASIQFQNKNNLSGRLLITSAGPKEGKSVVSANLAIVLAQSGYNVLLIDADLRIPSQHQIFGLSNNGGLIGLLLNYNPNGNGHDLKTLLKKYTQGTDQENLSILVSGSSSNGPQLLSLEVTKDLLLKVSSIYDYVVIDSPPLLAAPDALILSTEVDSVILLASAGTTRRKELRQATDQMKDIEANLIGVTLNRLKTSGGAYYYRYHSYYMEGETSSQKVEKQENQVHQNWKSPEQLGESKST